ncbi:MAG: hypothetical protein ACQESE_04125, partial [Nanobdellota archaeon]
MNWEIPLMILLVSLSFMSCTSQQSEFVPNELISESSIRTFSENSLILDDGSEVALPKGLSDTFNETEKVRSKANNSTSSDVIKNYLDRTVIERTTVVEVTSNEEYEDVFGNETPEYNITNHTSGLDTESVIEKVSESCVDDRTKPFCDRSPEELKKILENKSGTYEIVESVSVRQVPLEYFTFNETSYPSLLMDPLEVMVPQTMIDDEDDETFLGLMPLQAMQYTGPSYQQEVFIDGFTYGFELSYEKKYSWSAFGKELAMARLYSYIGYGLGLRIPFKTELNVHNSVMNSTEENFNAEISVEPLDLDAQGYSDAGLSNMHLFDGKELVLKFGAEAGAKIKMLGTTVYDSGFGKLIDNSRDFAPPLDGEMVNLGRLVFEGTDTGLYYGEEDLFVDGDIGISFNLKGERVKFDCEGVNTNCPSTINLESSESLNLSFDPLLFDQEDDFGKYTHFGIALTNPRYVSKANFGADFSIEAGVKVPTLGWKTVRTPWIELYSFDVDLPHLTRHSGTPNRLASVENKVYMDIPVFDNETLSLLGGPLALNSTSRCQKLQNLASEGQEVEGVEDEEINIYTEFGDAIGSITIE